MATAAMRRAVSSSIVLWAVALGSPASAQTDEADSGAEDATASEDPDADDDSNDQNEPNEPDEPDEANEPPKDPLRMAAYSAFGLGVAGAVAGTVFALGAKSDFDERDGVCPGGGVDCRRANRTRIRELDDSGSSKQTIATMSFAVAGLGIAGGIVLFLLSSEPDESAPTGAFVAPSIGPTTVGAFGRF